LKINELIFKSSNFQIFKLTHMLFEEFFKKKKIDLAALQVAEGSLFSEFKDHFEQMGEKSFDHTKKYWFNKLRHRFPLAPEIKTERLHIANPLAEQTITDGLTTPATPSPKVGFTPKFGATAVPPKPVEEKPEETTPASASIPSENMAPKPAFKPRFNPGMVKPKAVEGADAIEQKTDVAGGAATPPADTPAAMPPGFKPRFNAAMVKPKPAEESDVPADKPEVKEQSPAPAAETPVAKPGFKPRFNAAMMKPKPAEGTGPLAEKPAEKEEIPVEPTAAAAAKPGFKPRFNADMMKPKPIAEEEATSAPEVSARPATPPQPEAGTDEPAQETPAAKPAYKPKFNMKTLPKKPDQE
jgi:hypothetical protein